MFSQYETMALGFGSVMLAHVLLILEFTTHSNNFIEEKKMTSHFKQKQKHQNIVLQTFDLWSCGFHSFYFYKGSDGFRPNENVIVFPILVLRQLR